MHACKFRAFRVMYEQPGYDVMVCAAAVNNE